MASGVVGVGRERWWYFRRRRRRGFETKTGYRDVEGAKGGKRKGRRGEKRMELGKRVGDGSW